MKKNGRAAKKPVAKPRRYPPGWDRKRAQEVLAYYENQTAAEQVAEHEAAYKTQGETMIGVPTDLLPAVRKLLARRRRKS